MRIMGIIILAGLLGAVATEAQVPPAFTYQGVLQDSHGDPVPDGNYTVRFLLYRAPSGGTSLWHETQTVTCQDGLFSVILGSVTPLTLDFTDTYWLELVLSGEPPMTPRVVLTAVPYAIHALDAGSGGGDDDWIIQGDDIYHVPGQVAIGSTPLAGDSPSGSAGKEDNPNPANTKLYVESGTNSIFAQMIETDAAGDERAAVYAKRSRIVANPGSGFQPHQTNTAVTAINGDGDSYTFGLAGYSSLDSPYTGAVFGSNLDATNWGALGYRGASAQPWGLYTPGAAYVGATLVTNYMQIPTGAVDGYVLTSDINGFAHWEPPAGGFSLPYYGTASYTGSAFKVGNTYVGENAAIEGFCSGRYGGYFTASRQNSSTQALHAEVTATGNYHAVGVYGLSTPAENYGYGGYFRGGNKGVWGKVIATQQVANSYYGVDGLVEGLYGFNYGVRGQVTTGDNINYGVYGSSTADGANYGVYGTATGGSTTYAGYFNGPVHVNGTLSKSAGSFRIDHPLDPENKYLSHSFVESPDMMNVYNGNVQLDGAGEAWVTMPDWFEALNRDFRYQLTAVGAPGPNLYVAEKIAGNQFKIAGGAPGLEVSWQVTGIRQDPYAEAHRIPVEETKRPEERGRFLNPEQYGRPLSEGLHQPVEHDEPADPDGL